jgi:hypothetical protein
MRGRGLSVALIGALAIALVGIGCGGGDGGGSQVVANTEISKQTYLKKAEAICKRNYTNVKSGYEAFVKEHGGPENSFDEPEKQAEYVESVIVPEKKKTVEELKALGSPSGEEKKVGAIVEAYEEGIEVAEEEPQRAMSSQGVFAYATHVAQEYGLENCIY